MAVTEEILKRSLSINIEDGMSASGSPKTKARTYSGIKNDAAADKLYAAGEALGSLMKKTVQSISVTEKTELAESM